MDTFVSGKVCFSYKAHLSFGDSLRVVGSCESLGSWNPDQGVTLLTSEATFPMWSTPRPVELPFNQVIEYKYVIIRGNSYVWERLPGNRSVHVSSKMILIEDTENRVTAKHFIKTCSSEHFDAPELKKFTSTSKPFSDAEQFSLADSIIIVSMLLPVSVTLSASYTPEKPREEKFVFGDRTQLWLPVLHEVAVAEGLKVKWVGSLTLNIPDAEDQEYLSAVLRKRFNCFPIFLNEQQRADHSSYCHGIIFPVFHYIISTDPKSIPQCSLEKWDSYREVNCAFAEKVMEVYTGCELVWINDYQLLLVPSFISRKVREPVNIGLYLHIPFPSSEMFRVIPHREAILHAMLCCDLIGFHLFEHARHFLTCCKRILGVGHKCSRGGFIGIDFCGRYIMLRVGHFGVEPKMLQYKARSEESVRYYEQLKAQYHNKVLLIGLDPLFRLSGVSLKMVAYKELMYELDPADAQRVVFLQFLTKPANSDPEEVESVRRELFALNAEITAEFGREIIQLIEHDLKTEERLALFKASTAIIITTIRDGLNLTPFEYIVVKGKAPGFVILSEFAGVSLALCSPIRHNPFDLNALKESIYSVIQNSDIVNQVPIQERDYHFVLTHTTFRWAEHFLSDLKKAQKQVKRFNYVVHGFGDRVNLVALRKRLTFLFDEDVLEAYRKTRCRAFLFESEGTLSSSLKSPDPLTAEKDAKNLLLLDELSKDERNSIFVVSSAERKLLENHYQSVWNIGLAAEHGALLKESRDDSWKLLPAITNRWKDLAADVIAGYVTRTEGSLCDVKETSVVFEYRNADPDYGDWQAKELILQLDLIMRPYSDECEVCSGAGYVEVKPRGTNKGTALRAICKRIHDSKGEIDFIMVVGHDATDEEMFAEIKQLRTERSKYFVPDGPKVITCTIGKKPTMAKYYINDENELTHVLDVLRNSSVKVRGRQTSRFNSHSDLRSLVQDNANSQIRSLRASFGSHHHKRSSSLITYEELDEEDHKFFSKR